MDTAEENGLEAKYERDNYVEKGTGFETEKMIKDEEKNNLVVEIETDPKQHILYKAGDHPPIYLTIFCGFQVIFLFCMKVYFCPYMQDESCLYAR